MNDVMGRIAALRARFEPAAVARPTATSTSATSTTATDFATLLASAAAGAGVDTTAHTGAGSASGSAILGTDTTSIATLTRLLAGLSGTTSATSTSAPSSGAAPAGFDDYAPVIKQIATEEGVPASLLGALVWSESSFDPNAVSSAGARGLAQLMPATAASLGVDIDDPLDNLRGGARYLRQMLDRFDTVDQALAAYNAGPGAVQRYGGVPPYTETQNYVAKVLARAETLTGADA